MLLLSAESIGDQRDITSISKRFAGTSRYSAARAAHRLGPVRWNYVISLPVLALRMSARRTTRGLVGLRMA